MTDVMGWHLDQGGELTCSTPADLALVPLEEQRPPTDPVAYHGRQGVITRWWSSTNRSSVVCGSLRRTRVAMEMDFDPDVVRFSGEPLELHWQSGQARRRWRPDFMARTADGRRAVVVVRPEEPGPQWRERLAVLGEVAQQADWRVQERSVPCGVRRANLEWAAGFRQPFPVTRQEERALLAAFAQRRPVLDGVAASGLPYLSGLDLAWRLVWQRRLLADWDAPLLPTSLAWAAGATRCLGS
jgi:hypothetical protein